MSQFVRGLPKSFGPAVLLLLIACAAASSQEGSQSGAPELGRVRTLLEKGEHDSATKVSRKVIADPATDSGTLLQLGQLLAEHQILPEARAAFTRVLERTPRSFPATYNLGFAYFQEGNLEQARKHLARSVELDAASPQANMLLGITLVRLGKTQEGLLQLQRTERLDPHNVELLKLLAMQYSGGGLAQRSPGFAASSSGSRGGGSEPLHIAR